MEISERTRTGGGVSFLTQVVLAATSLVWLSGAVAEAQTFNVLYNFAGNGSNGAPYQPYNGLAMTPGGILYGTTLKGGSYEDGTAFQLKRAGAGWLLNVLYNFQGGTDGTGPVAGVSIGPGGVLYGTTPAGGDPGCGLAGGCGIVYSLRPPAHSTGSTVTPWTETVLYRFPGGDDGAVPKYGAVAFDGNGNLYGTTQYGGNVCGSPGCGTVYQLSPSGGSWTESVLHSFSPRDDGSQPLGGVVLDRYGDVYGATSVGNETLFAMEQDGNGYWDYYDVYQFTSLDGCAINTGLLLDPSFNLYGVAQGCGPGGANAGGTVFDYFYALDPVYNFSLTRAPVSAPEGPLIEDASGNLYGVSFNGGANQQGAVYKLTLGNGWHYTDVYDFTGGSDGAGPIGNLVMDASGNLYGVTTAGGSQGGGVIFEIATQ